MKTTPTLGLKLYDGTDAPDLVSGYNASMSAIDGSGVLAFQGTVQDSTDWDTIIDAGYYNCSNTKFSSANHSPVGLNNYGVLVVYNRCGSPDASKCATQIYYPHAGISANHAPVSRGFYSNAWSAWAPLVEVPDAPTWETLKGKPFSTVGKTLTTRDGALDLSTAAQASLVPAGGAAGQVLSKKTATDHDCVWVNPGALDTIYEYKTVTGLTAWLRAFPSTGEWWSGPGEVTITANGSTQQYTGNWTVYRTPSIGNAYFQGSEGRADSEGRVETAHFASLKIDHNANCWAFVMSIEGTRPTFQYVGSINDQLTAMLKPVTTIDPS